MWLYRKYNAFKRRWELFRNLEKIEQRLHNLEENLYAEIEDPHVYRPNIMSREDTVRWLIDTHGSICRFGDGEFMQIWGGEMGFQKHDDEMGTRLKSILQNPVDTCLVGLTDIFGSLANAPYWAQCYSRNVAVKARHEILPIISNEYKVFGHTEATRPYWPSLDREYALMVFNLWKELFRGRNILIVEGRCTRLGVGNDLLLVRRILCPEKNAYDKYDEILAEIRRLACRDTLILIALGGTATILAYDLARLGFQAVDVGHLDVQYMYMKMRATTLVQIPGKYTNECGGYGTSLTDARTEEELSQTVSEILL